MGERFSLLYRYSIDKMKTWTDFTDIVDSSKTKVTWQLCSTECKSIKDKASITLPSQDSELKTDFIKAMLEEYEIYVQIFDLEPLAMRWEGDAMMWENREMLWKFSSAIFTGVVDKKNSTTIKSFPFTPSVTLSLQDLSSLKLDDNVASYVFLEDSDSDKLTVTKIVKHLLDLAGCSYTADSIKDSEEVVLPCFVIDKDNAKTYREYIDTLLFEVGGYVLDFDEYGKAKIVRLPWDDSDKDNARTIDNPTIADGVSTKIDILSEDGIKLTWSTLAESSKDQIVYQDSISRSVEDGVLKGVEIPNEGYWPEDGDITATYQEFSADFLDKPYLYQDSRKKNEDLSIIIVRDVYATIQATDYQNKAFTKWEYPVLPSLGMKKNPTIYPTKAWYLLRNNSGNTVDLQFFTLRGRVLYRSAVNEETTPLTASKPKEYTSTYIYTKTHAKQFSQFYWHYLNTTRYVTTFTEINRGYLGETVRINHKGVEYGQDAMVVSQEITWLNRKTKKTTSTAIAVSAYNEYESSSNSRVPGRKERGNGIEKIEYKYAVTPTQDKPNPEDVVLDNMPTLSETDKYLWRKETIVFTDPSFPNSVSIVLVAVYGDKGDPALVWDFRVSNQTFVRNKRKSGGQYITIAKDIQGYDVEPSWNSTAGELEEKDGTIQLYIPYVNDYDRVIVTMYYGSTLEVSKTLSVVDKTSSPIQLATVDDESQLPKTLNKNNEHASIGDYLIRYDYILVKFQKVLSSEPFNPNVVYYLKDSSGVFIKQDIAAFEQGKTYYRFAPTPYMYNGSFPYSVDSWSTDVERFIYANTVEEVVELAKNQPGENYYNCLYAYSIYVNNLVAAMITVGSLFANNIESTNYKEDSNGYPVQGYKMEAQSGTIKAVGSQFVNSNIFGVLDLTKTVDGITKSKAEIIHPALTTFAAVEGASSSSPIVSASGWSVQDVISKMAKNKWYTDAQGTFKGNSFQGMAYVTDVNAYKFDPFAANLALREGDWGASSLVKTYTYTSPVASKINISGQCSYIGGSPMGDIGSTRAVTIYQNGSKVYEKSSPSDFSIEQTIVAAVGDVIEIYNSECFYCSFVQDGIKYKEDGKTQIGLWLADALLSEAAVLSSSDILSITNPSSLVFVSTNNIRYKECGSLITYCNTYCTDVGTPYSASDVSFKYWTGSAMEAFPITNVVRNSSSSITLVSDSGRTFSFTDGTLYPYEGGFKILGSEEGIRTKSLYPLSAGTQTIGFVNRKYAEGNFVQINNTNFNGSSVVCNTINVVSS